jgi:hypothetical protein
MKNLNEQAYELLGWAFGVVEQVGLPIAILAWLTVFVSSVAMIFVLRRSGSIRGVWVPSAAVGIASLVAHLLDYAVTLHITPTLSLEANPIWRIVIDEFDLATAKFYGLSGKVLLAILSFELYAFYLIQRVELFPEHASGFLSFWKGYGSRNRKRHRVSWSNSVNFFAFAFSLLGPFFFYVALLNSLIDNPNYLFFPALPIALSSYLVLVVLLYFVSTYRAYGSSR